MEEEETYSTKNFYPTSGTTEPEETCPSPAPAPGEVTGLSAGTHTWIETEMEENLLRRVNHHTTMDMTMMMAEAEEEKEEEEEEQVPLLRDEMSTPAAYNPLQPSYTTPVSMTQAVQRTLTPVALAPAPDQTTQGLMLAQELLHSGNPGRPAMTRSCPPPPPGPGPAAVVSRPSRPAAVAMTTAGTVIQQQPPLLNNNNTLCSPLPLPPQLQYVYQQPAHFRLNPSSGITMMTTTAPGSAHQAPGPWSE